MNSSDDDSRQAARQTWLVALAAALLSLLALVYCFQHDLLLLYGDAVAHLHIARRIVDSQTPGFRQLGSVWLPLPHLLLLPFVQSMAAWQSGLAGAWPSMACYMTACAGLYRLARLWLSTRASLAAALFFGLNPGLLYMQTTAMTEPLFLAEMIWSALLLVLCCRALEREDPRAARRHLLLAGLVLVAAIYTRYDGWVLAGLAWLLLAAKLWRHKTWRRPIGRSFVLFTALLALAPALWLAYNAALFGDPLDFLRGPYSAAAIERRTSAPGSAHYPGYHSLRVAALHFLKAAEMGAVARGWENRLLWLAAAGSVVAAVRFRGRGIGFALLLWMPLPFYSYSIAYGSVPIFIPVWWPFSWYNTRYGMELLPAFALFTAFCVGAVLDWLAGRQRAQWLIVAAAIAAIAANALSLLRAGPLVFEEAVANSRTRIPFERALADAIRALPPEGSILMYTSAHVGALQQAGIELRRTINEGDFHRYARALDRPASAGSVVAIDGDPVSQAVALHPEGLELLQVICSTGQPCARVYRAQVNTLPSPATPGR